MHPARWDFPGLHRSLAWGSTSTGLFFTLTGEHGLVDKAVFQRGYSTRLSCRPPDRLDNNRRRHFCHLETRFRSWVGWPSYIYSVSPDILRSRESSLKKEMIFQPYSNFWRNLGAPLHPKIKTFQYGVAFAKWRFLCGSQKSIIGGKSSHSCLLECQEYLPTFFMDNVPTILFTIRSF